VKSMRGSPQYQSSRLSVQLPQRHRRMLERSRGWVNYLPSPTPILGSNHIGRIRRRRRRVWMFTRRMSRYLGCTRRHLYWLIRNRRFPFHVFGSGPFPRYIFEIREVNRWLSAYRGKGRQLGLRRVRFGKIRWRQRSIRNAAGSMDRSIHSSHSCLAEEKRRDH
jgi:hypothetical protein